MAKILNGKIVRDKIVARLRAKILKSKSKPTLAVIQVGNLPESNAYIKQKKLFAEKIGAGFSHFKLPISVQDKKLTAKIQSLNRNDKVNGIIVQMPIPKRLDKEKIVEMIAPEKDVDGLHSKNISKLLAGKKARAFLPATARGVQELMQYYRIPMAGKKAVVIGRSTLVGKPIALSLLNADATITMAHSRTKKLAEIIRAADIVVSAAGKPGLIGRASVRRGQTLIDVGLSTKKLLGDADFAAVSKIVKAISPVPGGVGPMTVAALFENLIDAYERQRGNM